MTRVERDVILRPDGDSILERGQDRVVVIDGARYLASSQGSFSITDAPCTWDESGVRGSAFLVRLAE